MFYTVKLPYASTRSKQLGEGWRTKKTQQMTIRRVHPSVKGLSCERAAIRPLSERIESFEHLFRHLQASLFPTQLLISEPNCT